MKNGNVHVLKRNTQLKALYTVIRDKNTKRDDFVFFSERIIRLLVEHALSLLPVKTKIVKTPAGHHYKGLVFKGDVCAVSIVRAGEAMEKVVRDVCPNIRLGKILIQRDEKTVKPQLYYCKLPKDVSKRYVLLIDPMMATGGSLCKAIETLKKHGVKEQNIIFINMITCPNGINTVRKAYPKIRIVTGAIDKGLNSEAFIVPGLGDFGDRYFGTN